MDGPDLRELRLGELELVRRLHVTLRGPDWETVEPQLDDLSVETESRKTEVRFGATHRGGGVCFRWTGLIVVQPDRLEYAVEGVADSTFETSRLGLCVLYPPREYCGRPLRAEGPRGETRSEFPAPTGVAVQPVVDGIQQALFPPMQTLAVDLAERVHVHFDFDGDLFEIEDQRNWTDASFKAYCTPLAVPFPRRVDHGEIVRQRVVLTVRSARAGRTRPRQIGMDEIIVGSPTRMVVPKVGVNVVAPYDGAEAAHALRPGLIRAEIELDSDIESSLAKVAALAEVARSELEVALRVPVQAASDVVSATAPLAALCPARVTLLHPDADVTDPAALRLLAEGLPQSIVGGGTDRHFVDINRNRPGRDAALVCWPMDPQAHAVDERSILETTEVHGDLVRTASEFAPRAQLTTWTRLAPLPTSDPRQATTFAAAYTTASFCALAPTDVSAVYFHELSGPRGVYWEGNEASWAELAGPRSPAFHALGAITPIAGAQLLRTDGTRTVACLAAHAPASVSVLIANRRARPSRVTVPRLADRCEISRIGDDTKSDASTQPTLQVVEQRWPRMFELSAYEVIIVRIDPSRLVRGIQ